VGGRMCFGERANMGSRPGGGEGRAHRARSDSGRLSADPSTSLGMTASADPSTPRCALRSG
jgi:hypothetical protein